MQEDYSLPSPEMLKREVREVTGLTITMDHVFNEYKYNSHPQKKNFPQGVINYYNWHDNIILVPQAFNSRKNSLPPEDIYPTEILENIKEFPWFHKDRFIFFLDDKPFKTCKEVLLHIAAKILTHIN